MFDLALFQPPTTAGQPYTQALITDTSSGIAVQAEQSLAQRFVMALMTTIGTVAYRPTWGSSFPLNAAAANLLTELDVFAAFYSALPQVTATLQGDEEITDPDNESFGGAELLQVTIAPGVASLLIQVASLAGNTGIVNLPLVFEN